MALLNPVWDGGERFIILKAFNNNQLNLHPFRDDVFDKDTNRHAGENPRLFFCQSREVWRQFNEDALILDRPDHPAHRFARGKHPGVFLPAPQQFFVRKGDTAVFDGFDHSKDILPG